MDKDKQIITHIKESWFPNHQAKLTDLGPLTILDWKKPGTIIYFCRYVFDREFVYISGDIGEAVFRLTWPASIHSFNIDIHYFYEKLRAFCDDKVDFDGEQAVQRLREWCEELIKERRKFSKETMKQLIKDAGDCSSVQEWVKIIEDNEYEDFFRSFDHDYYWLYNIGNAIPRRIYGYLVGLQMASEQLKKRGKEASRHENRSQTESPDSCSQDPARSG